MSICIAQLHSKPLFSNPQKNLPWPVQSCCQWQRRWRHCNISQGAKIYFILVMHNGRPVLYANISRATSPHHITTHHISSGCTWKYNISTPWLTQLADDNGENTFTSSHTYSWGGCGR